MFHSSRHRTVHTPQQTAPDEGSTGGGIQGRSALPGGANPVRREIRRLVEEASQGGDPDHYAGKRHAMRFNAGMMLEATLDPRSPTASRWPLTMHNVSEGGFGFWSKRKMELNDLLYVRAFNPDDSGRWLRARVTHCTVGIRGFLIGVAFEAGAAPS